MKRAAVPDRKLAVREHPDTRSGRLRVRELHSPVRALDVLRFMAGHRELKAGTFKALCPVLPVWQAHLPGPADQTLFGRIATHADMGRATAPVDVCDLGERANLNRVVAAAK